MLIGLTLAVLFLADMYEADCRHGYKCQIDDGLSRPCVPCSSNNVVCVITEDYCRYFGGDLVGDVCDFNGVIFNRDKCLESGARWSEDEQRCDFSAKCPYQRKRGAV